MAETSTKPYLIRAIYEWCNDNGFTPYLAVAVDERTRVPQEHVKAGEIVLNVSPMATHRLELGNDLITFQARFAGVARELSIPVENVSAVYARENGHGMAFDVPRALAVADSAADPAATGPQPVVLESVAPADPHARPPAEPAGDPPAPTPDDGGPRGGRPRLTRVK